MKFDNDDLTGMFKYLDVDIKLVQYRDGKPPRVQIAYDDAKKFVYKMLDAATQLKRVTHVLKEANDRLAKRSDITTHRLDPDQFERLGDIFTLPTERERELQTRVEHLETEANQRSQGLDGMPLPRSNY